MIMRPKPLWLAFVLCTACTEELVVFQPDPVMPGEPTPEDGATATPHPAMDGGMDAALDGPGSPDAAIALDERRLQVIAAFGHTCAIREHDLYCWGDNRLDQGGGAPDPGKFAHKLAGPFGSVCAGEHHGCALRTTGELLCWGSNRSGQLGLGDGTKRTGPTAIAGLRFRALSCGGDSSCAIDAKGALYCWGDNFEGKLGRDTAPDPSISFVPLRIELPDAVSQVSVGQGHTCAITEAGALYCWGRNTDMQVGVSATDPQLRAPQRVDPSFRYRQVAAGQQHTCAIREDGRLICWGTRAPRAFEGPQPIGPRLIEEATGYDDVQVGWFHSCARKGGTLHCWGRNTEGQLGLGDDLPRAMPTQVGPFTDWEAVTTGHLHTCAARLGKLWCWGDNALGQLAPGLGVRRPTPTMIAIP